MRMLHQSVLIAAVMAVSACGQAAVQNSGAPPTASAPALAALAEATPLSVAPNPKALGKPTTTVPISGRDGTRPGYIQGSASSTPLSLVLVNGLPADEVVNDAGDVVGYFFLGPIGFVDTPTLQERANLECIAAAVDDRTPGLTCDALFKALGVVDGVAAFNE